MFLWIQVDIETKYNELYEDTVKRHGCDTILATVLATMKLQADTNRQLVDRIRTLDQRQSSQIKELNAQIKQQGILIKEINKQYKVQQAAIT